MSLLRGLFLMTLLFCSPAGLASAVPIDFQLDSVTIAGGFPTSQSFFPALPIPGSGDIDFANGTGVLTLNGHFIFLDLNNDGFDARLAVNPWMQTITDIDAAGNITSIGLGTVTCENLGGFGNAICAAVPTTVAGWPPVDGDTLPSSAVIDRVARTITVIDNSNATAGTSTSRYSYSLVPEPGTGMLAGLGLAGLALARRGKKLASQGS